MLNPLYNAAAGIIKRLAAPKPLQSTADYNKQLQATHAANVARADRPAQPGEQVVTVSSLMAPKPPANPAMSSPRPPMAVQPPKPPAAPYGGSPASDDPAMVGGRVMEASRAPVAPPAASPAAPAPDTRNAQLEALRRSYLGTFGPSEAETAAQRSLGDVAARTAADEAAARSAYAKRVGAINEQATLQPFLTGRQRMASGELADQLAALRAGSEAQTLPLSQRLAQMQAERTAQKERAKAELEFATPEKPDYQTVSEGESVIDPATGKVIYQGTPKAVAEKEPKVIGSDSTGYYERQADGSYKQVVAPGAETGSNSGNRVLSPTEAQALGVPFGTTADQAYGLSPTGKPTVEESKARQFAVAAENANNVLNTIGYDPGFIENPWMPNVLKGAQRQQFEQAARAFVNATLRRESGATITDSEFTNKYKELIDQAGDSDEVKAQKADARAAAVKSIQEAGRTGTQPSGGEAGIQNGIIVDPDAFLDSF